MLMVFFRSILVIIGCAVVALPVSLTLRLLSWLVSWLRARLYGALFGAGTTTSAATFGG